MWLLSFFKYLINTKCTCGNHSLTADKRALLLVKPWACIFSEHSSRILWYESISGFLLLSGEKTGAVSCWPRAGFLQMPRGASRKEWPYGATGNLGLHTKIRSHTLKFQDLSEIVLLYEVS